MQVDEFLHFLRENHEAEKGYTVCVGQGQPDLDSSDCNHNRRKMHN